MEKLSRLLKFARDPAFEIRASDSKCKLAVIDCEPYFEKAFKDIRKQLKVRRYQLTELSLCELNAVVKSCEILGIEAVGGFSPTSVKLAAIANSALGRTSPSMTSLVHGLNKCLAQTLNSGQLFSTPVNPTRETAKDILDRIPPDAWPLLLSSACVSVDVPSQLLNCPDELMRHLQRFREDKEQVEIHKEYEARLLQATEPVSSGPLPQQMLQEPAPESATMYAYDGYVTTRGEVFDYGIAEAVLDGWRVAYYIVPPVSIPPRESVRISNFIRKMMHGWIGLGFLNDFFHAEFYRLRDGTLKLKQLSARPEQTLHYNYFYSYGALQFADNLLLSAGHSPSRRTPYMMWRTGLKMRHSMLVNVALQQPNMILQWIRANSAGMLYRTQRLPFRPIYRPRQHALLWNSNGQGLLVLQLWLRSRTKKGLLAKYDAVKKRIRKSYHE